MSTRKRRKPGIRSLSEAKQKRIQGGPLNRGGRPKGKGKRIAERDLKIIKVYISLCDQWEVPKRGRRKEVLEKFSNLEGKLFSLSESSFNRIISEWITYYKSSGVAPYDSNDPISALHWHVLVEGFENYYRDKHNI